MIKSMGMLIAIAVLSGCATHPGYNTPQASNADQEYCRYEALRATASAPGGSIGNEYLAANTIANDIAVGMRQGELMALCLRQRQLRP